jgi:hypothetical protein
MPVTESYPKPINRAKQEAQRSTARVDAYLAYLVTQVLSGRGRAHGESGAVQESQPEGCPLSMDALCLGHQASEGVQ